MTSDNKEAAPRVAKFTQPLIASVAAIVGFAAVYVMLAPHDNAPARLAGVSPVAAEAVAAPAEPSPVADGEALNTGEMSNFVFKSAPEPLDDVAFVDGDEKPMTLADFKGRVVLLNLWATWCAPCRKEMPGLDRLQAEMGSDQFEVVALSVDRAGVKASQKFLDQIAVKSLKTYVDATARVSKPLRVVGMPTTILIDREGREVGRLIGPAEWDTEEAKRLIKSVL